jgi:hypothetical protein
MCFSAEASFTVGSALVIIGGLCIKKTKNWKLSLIALFPLFFGIQQLAEGIIWLHMNETLEVTPASRVAQLIFLFFAWMVWPVYVPIAFYVAENDTWRRAICVVAFLIGFLIFYVDVRFLMNENVIATIEGNRIYYPASPPWANWLYGFSTIVPILISEIKNMWIFGVVLLTSFVASEFISHITFSSVWCFFAATSCLLLYRILVKQQTSDLQESKVKAKIK